MTLWDQINEPVTYAIPFFLLAVVVEALSLRHDTHDRRGFDRTDTRTSLTMGVVSLVFNGGGRALALIGYAMLFVASPFHLDPHNGLVWAGVIVGVDLIWYVYHRMSHRIRLMWAAHQVHHNSRYFNYSTALRQKWNPWFELLLWTPLPLLGVPPWMIFTAFSVNLIYQFWVHTETIGKLPRWFEFVFNTPSHHRVHHASDPEYLDKNFGGIFIIWDRLFGSFRAETFRPTYGLTKNIDSTNVLTLQYYEFGALWRDLRSARRSRDRFGYLFGPPGWQPALSPITAAESGDPAASR